MSGRENASVGCMPSKWLHRTAAIRNENATFKHFLMVSVFVPTCAIILPLNHDRIVSN